MWLRVLYFIIFLLKSKRNKIVLNYFFNPKIDTRKTNEFKIKFNSFKNSLLRNKKNIKVTDFGAGSSALKSDDRKVSKIATLAGLSNKKARLLFTLIQNHNSNKILELGTSVGLSSAAMSLSNTNSKIVSLEGCPETASIARNQFNKYKLNNVELVIGDFNSTLEEVITDKNFDLIYFDGNHQKEATLKYFYACLPTATESSIFIFDDIYWSKSMLEAWNIIKNHEKVALSLDLYHWGIIAFKNPTSIKHHTFFI